MSMEEKMDEVLKEIKAWLKDDIRQHDARLEEYKKHTSILHDIHREIRRMRQGDNE